VTIQEQMQEYADARAAYLSAASAAERLKGKQDRLHDALLERMESERIKSMRLEGGPLVEREEPTWYPSYQDKAAFRAWALENDPALVKQDPEFDQKLVNKLVRERIDNNQPLPPGLGAFPKPRISLRK
jgi:hypothetical protein